MSVWSQVQMLVKYLINKYFFKYVFQLFILLGIGIVGKEGM